MPCKHPPIPKSSGTNWIEKRGGLPEKIECVARALFHDGKKTKQKAYEFAVGIVRDWAEGRRGVSKKVQAEAAAAIARWDAMRASK